MATTPITSGGGSPTANPTQSGSTGSNPQATSSKTNPNVVGGANEYAGFAAPTRDDQPTIAGAPGAYYGNDSPGAPGNVVDRNRIPKTNDNVSKDVTLTSPAGTVSGNTWNGDTGVDMGGGYA